MYTVKIKLIRCVVILPFLSLLIIHEIQEQDRTIKSKINIFQFQDTEQIHFKIKPAITI